MTEQWKSVELRQGEKRKLVKDKRMDAHLREAQGPEMEGAERREESRERREKEETQGWWEAASGGRAGR